MKVNYGLRPAKAIERKMIVPFLRRLQLFGSLNQYRYIGFGAETFCDHSLIHKSLGITDLVSIEANSLESLRYLENRPTDHIEMVFGWSWKVLSKIKWDKRSIVWLDYECKLNGNVLSDITFLLDNLPLGSFFLITVNAERLTLEDDPIQFLKSNVGDLRVRRDLKVSDLSDWGTADEYYKIMIKEIERHLSTKNKKKSPGSEHRFTQVIHFWYEDNARMLTLGGILHDEGQASLVNACEFEKLPQFRSTCVAYQIQVPSLTYHEMRLLARMLKKRDDIVLGRAGLTEKHLAQYEKVHGFFPAFVESEL